MEQGLAKVRRAESLVFWFLALLGLGQVFLVAYVPRARDNAVLTRKAACLEADVERLRAACENLEKRHDALKNDPFYVEALARSQLNLAGVSEIELPRVAIPAESVAKRPSASTIPSQPGRTPLAQFLAPLADDALARGMALATGLMLVAAAFVISFRSAERRALHK